MHKKKSKSVFLEVDSKIIEDNLLLKSGNDEANDFESLLGVNQKSDPEPSKLITPTPGLVIKAFDIFGNKIFINVCKADEIPEPREISDSELLSLEECGYNTDYRVPLSISYPHNELDKTGNIAVTYDVAINSKFFEKIKCREILRAFLVQVIFQGLENKYKREINEEGYVILQYRTCVGEIKPHRIRNIIGPYVPPKRLIEEIPHKAIKSCERINSRLLRKDNILLAEFHLPTIMSSRDVQVFAGEDRLVINTRNYAYAEELFLPYKIKENEVTAYFNRSSKIIKVLMHYVIKQ